MELAGPGLGGVEGSPLVGREAGGGWALRLGVPTQLGSTAWSFGDDNSLCPGGCSAFCCSQHVFRFGFTKQCSFLPRHKYACV